MLEGKFLAKRTKVNCLLFCPLFLPPLLPCFRLLLCCVRVCTLPTAESPPLYCANPKVGRANLTLR